MAINGNILIIIIGMLLVISGVCLGFVYENGKYLVTVDCFDKMGGTILNTTCTQWYYPNWFLNTEGFILMILLGCFMSASGALKQYCTDDKQ